MNRKHSQNRGKTEMSEETVYVDFQTLENFMRDTLTAAGVPAEDAAVCADVLITADKLGIAGQGILRT